MANVAVNSKSNISGASVVAGDVIYVKDSNDVYDVIGTKLSVAGFGVVKVKADLWAVRNNALSLDYSPNSAYDVNKAYRKGATIAYLGNNFIANEFIPPGTALTYGTSGATWRAASGSGAMYTGGITATPRTKYGPTTLVSTHENFRAPQKNRNSLF
jgi:hypothetical protein